MGIAILLLLACEGVVVIQPPEVVVPSPTAVPPLPTPTDPVPTEPVVPPSLPTDDPLFGCEPNRAVFDANIAPILETRCQSCHGEVPAFGAPYPLLDYGDMVAHQAPLVATLMDGDMPPENARRIQHTQLDTFVSWLSCGALHPDPDPGLVSNRPVMTAPAAPPVDTYALELTAIDEPIGPDVLDDYRTFTFTNMVDSIQTIRRIEPAIDDARVVHHITLKRRGGDPYYYAWAPGTGPIEFPDGGIRISPQSRFELEIHYNNGAGVPDAVDSSGVRLWIGPEAGTRWVVASPQTWNIDIAPFSSGEAHQSCTVTTPFTILAGMPHMHAAGTDFQHEVVRTDGTTESLVELSGWAFEAQYIYEMNVDVDVGDVLNLTCTYYNDTENRILAGTGTEDEMCYDFLFITPPSAAGQCSGPF